MLYLALVALSLGLATFLDFGDGDSTGDESDNDGGDQGTTPDNGGSTPTPIPDPDPPPTRITGTFENDTVDLRGQSGSYNINLYEGGDRVYLGDDPSTVYAGTGPDRVVGGAGDDYIYLGDGRDQFDETRSAQTGDDLVRGGRGADKLVSRSGADTLWGDLGADDLYTIDDSSNPAEGDTAYGGFGKDRLWLDGGDIGYGGADADQFTLRTDSGVTAEPAVVGDFSAREDLLIIDLPNGHTATHDDLSFTGVNGSRITLTIHGQPVAVLDNVWFADLTTDNVVIR